MSADFQISLPPWPMARVLKEASAHWNLLHPDNLADPEESDWPLLCNVVHSFLRHQQTPEELERISAEIILTAAEIELVSAAQEAELRN
jgi:hypothetical protein